MGIAAAIAAFLELYKGIRETMDPEISEKWDRIVLEDYKRLRALFPPLEGKP